MKPNTTTRGRDLPQDRHDLTRCYGKIGISAVAAALSPQDVAKKPASDSEKDREKRHRPAVA